MFSVTSRYHEIEIATYVAADGREVPYVRRRFLPPADSFSLLAEHTVTQGERLDHVAYRYFRDPERFWRICDANRALWPDDLVAEAGHTILIPPYEG